MIRKLKTRPTRIQRTLLTDAWLADVQALEAGIREFGARPASENPWSISIFEMADDPHLHVNVTHTHETKRVKGWAGPGVSAVGFVHNRRFESASTDSILDDIRRMVFAPRA
jgi:hypothetical protein